MNNDLISREALNDIWELYKKYHRVGTNFHEFGVALKDIIDNAPTIELQMGRMTNGVIIPIERPQGKWIPITYRPVTDEEYEAYKELYESWLNVQREELKMFDCPMPEDGQEILISTKYGVEIDTCYADDGYYLDSNREWEEVYAWQPLPEPYKNRGEEE